MAGVLTLLSGNSNKGLAEGVAKALDGAPLGEVKVSKFANGETSVSVEYVRPLVQCRLVLACAH